MNTIFNIRAAQCEKTGLISFYSRTALRIIGRRYRLEFACSMSLDSVCSRFNASINALFSGVFIRLYLSARVIELSLKYPDGMTVARIGVDAARRTYLASN